MKKKSWERPELTVMVRNKPEEAVLNGCKTLDIASGPSNLEDGCWQYLDGGGG